MPIETITNPCPGTGTVPDETVGTFGKYRQAQCPHCGHWTPVNRTSGGLRKHAPDGSGTTVDAQSLGGNQRLDRIAEVKAERDQIEMAKKPPLPPVGVSEIDGTPDLAMMSRYLHDWKQQLWGAWVASGGSREARDHRLARAWQHAAALDALLATLVEERAVTPTEIAMKLLVKGIGICPKCNCIHPPDDPLCRANRPKDGL